MNTANNHIETFDSSETTVIAGKYTVQYGLGTQKFLDRHDILDGRRHLVAQYASEISSLTIAVVENELPNCLKENDDDLASGLWTVLTYVGVFETDEDAATMITGFLKDYEEVYHSCEHSLPIESLCCGYQDVSRSISENVNTKLDFHDGSTKPNKKLYVLYSYFHSSDSMYKSAVREAILDASLYLCDDSDACGISAVAMSNDVQELVIKHFNSVHADCELSLPI
ncbi:MAG: hypothetical protein HRU33_27120 [Rhodobacteraceae bacterium]|nr:hypothetical protein [Paracoccaceae bacterium]